MADVPLYRPLYRLVVLAGFCALACSPAGPKHQTFSPSETDYYVADPAVGHLHRPYAVRKMAWTEHPRGRIEFRTNNLGFREDRDTIPKPAPGTYRILATGDSHIDGVLWNDESFPNRLELYLNQAAGAAGKHFEVINGGVGYYGPFEYRRFFEREDSLEPDLLLVNVFLGNDFMDTCRELEATTQLGRPRPDDYRKKLLETGEVMPGTLAQSLNQLYYFKTFPHMVEPALAAAATQLILLKEEAAAAGRPLVVTLLPSLLETAPQSPPVAAHIAAAERILGADAEDFALQGRLRTELLARLQAGGVHVIDLYPSFAANPDGLYWLWDEHLSVRGHEKLADIVCDELAATEDLPCQEVDASTVPIFADGFESGDVSHWSLLYAQ